jgi:hypothetical protein
VSDNLVSVSFRDRHGTLWFGTVAGSPGSARRRIKFNFHRQSSSAVCKFLELTIASQKSVKLTWVSLS